MTKKEWVQAHFPEYSHEDNFGIYEAFFVKREDGSIYSRPEGNGVCPRDFDFSDFNCEHSTGNRWLCECCWNEEIEVND